MNEEKINLELLGTSSKRIMTGDVFVLRPKGHLLYYGIVANTNATMFSAKEIIHVQIFDYKSDVIQEIPDSLNKYPLLIPPILTNKLGWKKGYFKIIGNVSINNFMSVKEAAFFYYNGEIFNDNSQQLPKPYSIETTGSFSITSYLNIDNLISLRLGIPLAVTSPENWNPYWYQEELCTKYEIDQKMATGKSAKVDGKGKMKCSG
jgi:hypothetical protein